MESLLHIKMHKPRLGPQQALTERPVAGARAANAAAEAAAATAGGAADVAPGV